MSNRHKIFFILSALLFAVVLGRMHFLASSGGEAWRKSASNISSRTGKLSAIRGRIYDKNGKLLVWSERCYDLELVQLPATPERLAKLSAALLPGMQIGLSGEKLANASLPMVIKYNLTAEELTAADELAEQYSELDVSLRWERRSAVSLPAIGEVMQLDGMEYGISGLEKKFDDTLRGTPGTFSVMLDRHGRWVNSTFRILTAPCNGKDVYSDEEVPEKDHE